MTSNKINDQLSKITSESELEGNVDKLVSDWISTNVGFEAVNPILFFMESHPKWDFGMPGPFVHFLEKFYRKGYEKALVDSVERYPTSHTAWMLNRIINGEVDKVKKIEYLSVLAGAKNNKFIDSETVELIDDFLDFQEY